MTNRNNKRKQPVIHHSSASPYADKVQAPALKAAKKILQSPLPTVPKPSPIKRPHKKRK